MSNYSLEELLPGTDEFVRVSDLFNSNAITKTQTLKLIRIQKVHNYSLEAKFLRKKIYYEIVYKDVTIHNLFHGTKSSNIPSILEKNLDHRLHGKSTGHRFGAGVSFSGQASYASHYCDREGVGKMLLCKVLTSNIIDVPECKYSVLEEPPLLPEEPYLRYDTTAKNKLKMDVVVKWGDNEFYPTHVIHFTRVPRSFFSKFLFTYDFLS